MYILDYSHSRFHLKLKLKNYNSNRPINFSRDFSSYTLDKESDAELAPVYLNENLVDLKLFPYKGKFLNIRSYFCGKYYD